MVSWGGALLSAVGRGAEGGFRSKREDAEQTIKDQLEKMREEAMFEKQQRLEQMRQSFQTGERVAGQEYQSSERKATQRYRDKERFSANAMSAGQSLLNNQADIEQAKIRAASQERIAGMKPDPSEKMTGKDKAKVISDAMKAYLDDGNTDRANAMLNAAGLNTVEEYDTGEKEGGFWGFFQKNVKGVRQTGGQAPQKETSFDSLYNEVVGKKQPQTQSVPEDMPEASKPLLAQTETKQINPVLPSDPSQWNVKISYAGGVQQRVAVIDGQEIPLTEEEIKLWQSSNRRSLMSGEAPTAESYGLKQGVNTSGRR